MIRFSLFLLVTERKDWLAGWLVWFVLLPKIQLTQSKYLMAIKRNRFRNTVAAWCHRAGDNLSSI